MGNNLPAVQAPARTPAPADLNRVRDMMLSAQRTGELVPAPSRQVTVGRHGEIYTGDAPGNAPVSRVQHGTFAAPATTVDRRERNNLEYAATHLPPNTTFLNENGIRGYLYSFTSQLGRAYTMFAYFDGRSYQVKLVEPALEGRIGGHDGHLYLDGRLCLSQDPSSGQPSLGEAYSKSVVWAAGVDILLTGHPFPFSINNLNH